MSGFGTRAVHGAGERPAAPGPHAPPLHQTAGFSFPDGRDAVRAFREGDEYVYTRDANPTTRELERHLAALEATPVRAPDGGTREAPGDTDARFFSSGMAAISSVALAIAAGGRLVSQSGIYGSAEAMIGRLARLGVDVRFVPAGDLEALAAAVDDGPPPALVYVETPANPLVRTTDVARAAEIAHAAGALLAVDATFATPALLRPLAWGADLVLHSTTKFIGGHGVALGGVVAGRRELLEREVAPARKYFGGVADPFAAWLTLLGARTLAVRMERHVANARAMADFLRGDPSVQRVFHPDPGRLPAGQLAAPGPMLAFELEGGEERALGVLDALRLVTIAPTLGTVDTLVQHPYSMSHAVLPEERRRELGILPGILRISAGLEDPEDLVADLEEALERTRGGRVDG